MSFAMTVAERQAFLQGVHVGILSLPTPQRGPLSVPIWYDYAADGDVWFITDRDSRKGRLLAPGVRCSLCVQRETRPYQYVSIEGPIVALSDADLEQDLRPMARRYLGEVEGDAYTESMRAAWEEGGTLLVRVRPEHWLSGDYAKRSS